MFVGIAKRSTPTSASSNKPVGSVSTCMDAHALNGQRSSSFEVKVPGAGLLQAISATRPCAACGGALAGRASRSPFQSNCASLTRPAYGAMRNSPSWNGEMVPLARATRSSWLFTRKLLMRDPRAVSTSMDAGPSPATCHSRRVIPRPPVGFQSAQSPINVTHPLTINHS